MTEKKEDLILHVSILSPEEVLFEGDVNSLTCFNKEGEFDILPFHSNFISLIYQSITVYPINAPPKTISIGYALLKCISNTITILTNVDISSYSELLTAKNHTTKTNTK
ncbi:hypothetical protein KAZ66_01380 [Candidatus Woesebacteria bacterium]|nr:hypothetical protein [Candidatus Woesebacteria bacterium]